MIANSTVLISLGKIGSLDLLPECKVPVKVMEEMVQEPLWSAITIRKLPIITPSAQSREKALEILGDRDETGDSDVIAALLDFPNSVVATDDKRLRTVCRTLGGKITGTLGILIHAVRMKKTTKREAMDLLGQLEATGFRMSIALYEKVKKILNTV